MRHRPARPQCETGGIATDSPHKRPATGARSAVSSSLDVMLTDAVIDRGPARRFLEPASAVKVAAGLARHPNRMARRLGGLGLELGRAATGRSQQQPERGDRRFGDRGWQENAFLRGLLQGYLATVEAVDGLITDADLDWRSERQARFASANVLDALAPTNFPWSNPAVMRETIDRGGANLATGARRFVRDASARRLPDSVDTSQFEVGGNLAVSPGAVVLRTEVFELIQYQPTTERVHEVPLLLVPPTINRYYILDIAPGRSLVEYFVAQGQQVFLVSWRNPGAAQGHFDLDTYARAVLEARDAAAQIARQPAVNINAACSGGIIAAGALGHLADTDRLDEVASLTLFVCALDNARAGTVAAVANREMAAAAVAQSAREGYLDGQALAGVFAWLRPNDLIWNYHVNNYLMGKDPPAFDILYWNQDAVRLAAGLHRDFIHLGLENSFVPPGALTVLGSPVDLGKVTLDLYAVAGSTDHIVPWENAYRSVRLLGGEKRFVLSRSGHIQALVNPPSPESRSSYRVTDDPPADGPAWAAEAERKQGSWWPDYCAWLTARSGEERPAPKTLGSRKHAASAKAPGTYVHAA